MIFENPLGLLALSVIPLIILLHRFRQRPHRQNISSLFIWKKIEEFLVAKPIKRKSYLYLILILQILSVILLSLALAKPVWRVSQPEPLHLVFLIDNSASMGSDNYKPRDSATFVKVNRWELMKEKIKEVIVKAPQNTIVSFYQPPQQKSFIRLNRSETLDVINHLTLMEIPSDIESLVSATADIKGEFYFCSDKLPSESILSRFDQKPHLILVGEPSGNEAIINAAATPTPGKEDYYDIFVSVKNYSLKYPGKIKIDLIGLLNKKAEMKFASQEIDVGANETKDIFFHDIHLPEKLVLKIVLNSNSAGDMMCDNSVWLMPSPKDKINIALIGKSSPVLLKALRAIPYVLVAYSPTNDDSSKNDKYDVCIFNEIVPSNLPQKVIVIGGISNILTENQKFWKYEGKLPNPIIQKIEISSPILNYCAQDIFNTTPWAVRLTPTEKEYLKPIMQAKGTNGEDCILLAEWQKGNQQLIIINFPIDWRTDTNPNDWTGTPYFPIFWTNLINYLCPESESKLNNYILYRTGKTVENNIYFRTGWFDNGPGINLCDEQESDDNGITLIDTAIPSIDNLSGQKVKRIDLDNWSILTAGILLLLSWILMKLLV